MKLSERIARLKPSPTLALNTKANAMIKSGVKVANFAVGEPDFATPEIIVEKAIASLKKGRTKYGPAGGGMELRQAICRKMARDNKLSFTPDQVVCGVGAKEILFHLFLSLINEGDEVLVPSPYWVSYTDQILAAGGKPVVIPMPDARAIEDGSFLTPEILQKYATSRTVGIVLNSPNNPGGYICKEEPLRALGKFLATRSWWVISDEIYEFLAFDGPHVSILGLCPELSDRTIIVHGMSKGFGMTGWRVGWGAGPKPVMDLVRSIQGHSSTCLQGFIEDACVVALDAGRDLVATALESLKARRDVAVECLRAIPHIGYVKPEGAFYVLIDCRQAIQRSNIPQVKDSFSLGEWLLEKHHVALVPGSAFGAEGYLRLSYAVAETTVREGIESLKRGLHELTT
jgi:aspartate aminotransferase